MQIGKKRIAASDLFQFSWFQKNNWWMSLDIARGFLSPEGTVTEASEVNESCEDQRAKTHREIKRESVRRPVKWTRVYHLVLSHPSQCPIAGIQLYMSYTRDVEAVVGSRWAVAER